MKNILFVSLYPTGQQLADGMMRRIIAVDKILSGYNHLYVNISFRRNISESQYQLSEKIRIINLNYFLHKKRIMQYIESSEIIYVHSMYNMIRILPLVPMNSPFLVLDVHGVVPEENLYLKHFLRYLIMQNSEKEAFRRANVKIYVSESMKNYYQQKYGEYSEISIVFPILPDTLSYRAESIDEKAFRRELSLNEDDIVFIYSGGITKWQNVDLMLESFSKLSNPKYKLIILTKDIEEFREKVNTKNLQDRTIITFSPTDEIYKYYTIANYGFLLRDDHILNQVASPTKLTEYLAWNIIPILKSKNVGDLPLWDVDYITVDQLNNEMKKVKSGKNSKVVDELILKYSPEKFRNQLNL